MQYSLKPCCHRMAGRKLLMLEEGQVKEGLRDSAGDLGSTCQEQSKAGLPDECRAPASTAMGSRQEEDLDCILAPL